MTKAGRFFVVNRFGRWLNKHGHRFVHPGKTGRYAFRLGPQDRFECLLCRAVWTYIVTVMPSVKTEP